VTSRGRRRAGRGGRIGLLVALLAPLFGCGGGDDPSGAATTPAKRTTPARKAERPKIDLKADPAAIAARSSIPILCYHQIRDRTAADAAADRPYIMPPATFRRELDTLERDGYRTISPDELVAHLTTGARLPAKPVLLTFDDGVDDHYRVVLPELRRRGMKATFFPMTVVLGNPGFMTRGQLRRLDRAGMTIAAHSWDHHRVDEYSGDDWRIQITEPIRELQRIVGHRIRYFAYPFGLWKPEAFPRLRRAGIHAAFQLVERPIAFGAPLLTIRRKIASPDWTDREFRRALRTGFRKVAL
jgi:peptidoglycan/xylan/chitin deacetylase (PgdA/CDA1 family)